MMMRSTFLLVTTLACLAACGGGGGGGSSLPAASGSTGGSTAGGSTAGGSTGGGGAGGGGGASITARGLLSGATGVVADSSIGGVSLDVAIGGTGLSAARALAGDVQAFGSVIANGVESKTDTAEFLIEGTTGSQADLRQGQQVVILNDASNTALTVLYRANVKGPVENFVLVDPALGRSTFSALGQPVSTNASTTFANVNVGAIADGDLVEVSGTLDDAGTLLASYVEIKPALIEYKVVGVAANATATTFTLAGLDVDYATATLQNFSGATVADGDVLEARGAPGNYTPPDPFAPAVVEQFPLLRIGGSAPTEIEGFIDSFTAADDFTVQTVAVTTDSSTTYVNGGASSLAAGVKVEVEGPTDADGTIVAEKVTVQPAGTMRTEGNIDAPPAANTITVLGVTFEIRDLTEFEDDSSQSVDPLTLADLAQGDEVEIRGYVDGSGYVATEVRRQNENSRARLRGIVTAEDAAAGTLAIAGIPIRSGGGTQFEDANEAPVSAAAFFDALQVGDFVQATWDPFVSTAAAADQLALEDD